MRRASPQILVLFLLFTLALASALWFVAREEQRRKERLLVPTPEPAAPAAPAAPEPAQEPSAAPTPPPAEPALSESEAAERALWLCREAESALLAQDYATAEARALDSLALQPKAAATLRLLGHVYVCQGRPADALPALSEALRVEPLHPQALCDLSLAHFMQRNIPAALEAVDTCLRVHPNYPGALLQRGMLLLTVPDRCNEAADVLRQALVAFPENLAARNNLAIALIRAAKYDEAVAELDTVLEADPANYTALYHHAAIHIFQNDLPSAIPWLRRALQAANPDQQRAILGDPDLDPVRRDPLFLSLLDEFDPAHSIRIQP
jgi:tetratricopeptide (TPR) repeat protein